MLEEIYKFLKKHIYKTILGLLTMIAIPLALSLYSEKRQRVHEDARKIEEAIAVMRREISSFDNKVNDKNEITNLAGQDIKNLATSLEAEVNTIRGVILQFPFENDVIVKSNNPTLPKNSGRIQGKEYAVHILSQLQSEINQMRESAEFFDGCKKDNSDNKAVSCDFAKSMWHRSESLISVALNSLTQNIDSKENGVRHEMYICDPFYTAVPCRKN